MRMQVFSLDQPDAFGDHVGAEDVVVDGEGGAQIAPILSPPFAHVPVLKSSNCQLQKAT